MSTPSETPISTSSDTPMPSQSAGKAVRPTCPRCGYDQSGEVARWTESCPVKGTCPECGLEFAWDAAFFPERQKLTWLIEHAPSRWRAVGALFLTLFRLTLPWMFWSKVGLHHAVVVPRLCAWLAFGLFAVWIPLHAVTLISALYPLDNSGRADDYGLDNWFVSLAFPFLNAEARSVLESPNWVYWSSKSWTLFLLWLAPAGVLLLLASSRRTARIKKSHLFRSFVYAAWPWVVWNILAVCSLVAFIVGIRVAVRSPGMSSLESFIVYSEAAAAITVSERASFSYLGQWSENLQTAMLMLFVLWSLVYWFFTIRRGFQLKHPLAVWFACVIIAFLLSALGQALLGDITHKPFWGLWSIYR